MRERGDLGALWTRAAWIQRLRFVHIAKETLRELERECALTDSGRSNEEEGRTQATGIDAPAKQLDNFVVSFDSLPGHGVFPV